jgi:GNAT superfamily N-acetyltransferase
MIDKWLSEPGGNQLGWNEDCETRLDYYLNNPLITCGYTISEQGKDVGFIMIDHENYLNEKILHIDFILVRACERGRGIGARAIECLLRLDKWRGTLSVHTGIRMDNAGSKRFFTRFGFKALPKEDYGFTYVYEVPNAVRLPLSRDPPN